MATAKRRIAFRDKRNNVILVQDRISKTSKYSLRPALRARRITPFSKDIQPIPRGSVAINFGGAALPRDVQRAVDAGLCKVLNTIDKVSISSNKLRTFELLTKANVPCVRWTVDRAEALKWLGKGHKVLARVALASSGGRGIKVADNAAGLAEAPLFTRYFPKTHEFRVQVVGGEAIDVTEKKIRNDLREKREEHSIVRSHDNGWVHAHDALSITNDGDLGTLRTLACNAVKAIGLDFAAVDILACLDTGTPRRLTKAVVCEINSAPGIENEVTKTAYVRAFNKIIGGQS